MTQVPDMYEVCTFSDARVVIPRPMSRERAIDHAECLAKSRIQVKIPSKGWEIFRSQEDSDGVIKIGVVNSENPGSEVEFCHLVRPWSGVLNDRIRNKDEPLVRYQNIGY